MQIPQYERRPKEIPTYKPLQENLRFANPYPSSIEVGRAPIGEALGAIGRGLSDAWGRLQKMEDESYYQVMLPKTLIVAKQAEEDYKLHGNTNDPEYIAKGVSYINEAINKAWDEADFGYNPKKPEINNKVREILYSHNIVPSIATFGNIYAAAQVEKGQRNTDKSNNYFLEAASLNRQVEFYDSMANGAPAPIQNSAVNKFYTTSGTALEALKVGLTNTENSFRNGLLTADKVESTKQTFIETALLNPHNENIAFIKKDIDVLQGLDYSKAENVTLAHKIITRDLRLIADSKGQLNNTTWLIARYPDGSYDGELLYKKTATEIEARRHYWITKDPTNPPQMEVITKENIDNKLYYKLLDNYDNVEGMLLQYTGSIRLKTTKGRATTSGVIYGSTSVTDRINNKNTYGNNILGAGTSSQISKDRYKDGL